jgi:SAM-dependent methyltransferase
LVRCQKCDLYQLGDLSVVPEEYYEDYIMTTSFSKQINEYIDNLAKYIVDKYRLKNGLVYEVGCGDGIFCEYLIKHGADTIGVEPSTTFGKLAERKNIKVIYDYFSEDLNIPEKGVDAIVSRAVFEHLKNPNKVLKAMHKFLKDDGIGMIEVPSFEKALKFDRYYDIFSDHVAYYTKQSLVNLISLNNFKVLEVFDSYNDEFIVIIFKKDNDNEEKKFVSKYEEYKKDFIEKINMFIRDRKSVCMWGAGAKGLALLSMCNLNDSTIKFIVDSDINKIGKYSPGSHIEIFSPDVLKEKYVDVIIISAMAYEKEIRDYLKGINFAGEVYVISPILTRLGEL